MSRGVIALQFLGRMGNCMSSYAFARAFAEQNNLELQTDPWVGQKVFGLNDPPIDMSRVYLKPTLDENTITPDAKDFLFRSYCQQQKCLIYTRRDCLRWFKFAKEISDNLPVLKDNSLVAHIRRGDFLGYKYPCPSRASYTRLRDELFPHLDMLLISDEHPMHFDGFTDDLADIPDFWLMTKAPILLRANSTFSWWAGTLNHGAVYSPVMDGLEGGKEHDVQFVRGNWPKFRSDLPFLTDLHLPE